MPASKQASKQSSKHTHTHAQCSNASVGLAQAHPNDSRKQVPIVPVFCAPQSCTWILARVLKNRKLE